MIFTPLSLAGVVRVDLDRKEDSRGFFARSFCVGEFEAQGLFSSVAQMNTSFTLKKGSIRGFHFQRPPAAEDKLVRVVRGAILDVAVDLRAGSETYGQWVAVELSADNRAALHIPQGVAHGFQTLTDDVEMMYVHSCAFSPGHGDGVLFDDPDIAVDWPLPPTVISPKDRELQLLSALEPVAL